MAFTVPPPEDMVIKAIRDAVRERLDKITEEEFAAATERVKKRIPDVISSVSLQLFSALSYERMGTEVLMKVKVEGWQK